MPYFHFFPGNVIWIDAGLHDAPWTPGSIANILGMGGFHVITQVNHKGTLVAGKINKLETQFKASFILPGNPLVKNNIGRRLKPAQPPPETKPVGIRDVLRGDDVKRYDQTILDNADSLPGEIIAPVDKKIPWKNSPYYKISQFAYGTIDDYVSEMAKRDISDDELAKLQRFLTETYKE